MMNEKVRVLCQYAGFQPGLEYSVVSTGKDYYLLRKNGRVVYVPSSLIDFNDYHDYKDDFGDEYEDDNEDFVVYDKRKY